ncbi:MAG: glycerate kinase [Gammaproteobacteria bacterium]|nr:glycerate kinase [Gammaproteobacteria bacterium]
MKIVIAPDSFKECLTALEVAQAIEAGVRRIDRRARCIKVPMADGGEGTVQSLIDATGGRLVKKRVRGPLGAPVRAGYGLLGDGATAVIEMAQASGLPLVPRAERDPMRASTWGTGELMRDALDRGVRTIIVGIGGSATSDAGAGMAAALGVRFRDRRGRVLREPPAGGMLDRIAAIDLDGLDPRLRRVRVLVACDVDNPLVGPRGAAAVYGPQKGASAAQVRRLDANLTRFGRLIESALGVPVLQRAGAGAAGGLGAGLLAFAGARLRSGVGLVIEAVDLAGRMRGADLVMTGEGRVDFQTAFGKTPAGVARVARRLRIPVIAIGGSLADDAAGVFAHGIDGLEAAVVRPMDLDAAMAAAPALIADAAERVLRLLRIGRRLR